MNALQIWQWFDRSKITLIVAALALLIGTVSSWYQLPKEALDILETNLNFVYFCKVLAAIFACFSLFVLAQPRLNRLFRPAFWIGLLAILLLPYFVMVWSPRAAFLATALYDQSQHVTQHVENSFSQVQSQWKQHIRFDLAAPTPSTVALKLTNKNFFQPSALDWFLLEGLGYSNSFFGFIGRGWGITIAGLILALIGLYLQLTEARLSTLVADLGRIMPWFGLCLGLILVSLIGFNSLNDQTELAFVKGDYQTVIERSHFLEQSYPALKGDVDFVKRAALAHIYAQQPEAALVHFAQGLECYDRQDFSAAIVHFKQAITLNSDLFLARGYLATALLNSGIIDFDQDRPASAAQYFQQALTIFPAHLEGLYDLMLAQVVNGNFEQSALTAEQVIAVQSNFQIRSPALLGQAYLHRAWASYRDGDMLQAWQRYRQSIDQKSWE